MKDCRCLKPPFSCRDFKSNPVGVDETSGRYGDVAIETCRACGRRWLRYYVEHESISNSGRWYRALISKNESEKITPENAVSIIEKATTRFAGGSYFKDAGLDVQGFPDKGPVWLD